MDLPSPVSDSEHRRLTAALASALLRTRIHDSGVGPLHRGLAGDPGFASCSTPDGNVSPGSDRVSCLAGNASGGGRPSATRPCFRLRYTRFLKATADHRHRSGFAAAPSRLSDLGSGFNLGLFRPSFCHPTRARRCRPARPVTRLLDPENGRVGVLPDPGGGRPPGAPAQRRLGVGALRTPCTAEPIISESIARPRHGALPALYDVADRTMVSRGLRICKQHGTRKNSAATIDRRRGLLSPSLAQRWHQGHPHGHSAYIAS